MAEQHSSYAFATRALHVGQDSAQWKSRAVVPPIVMATTFAQLEPAVTAASCHFLQLLFFNFKHFRDLNMVVVEIQLEIRSSCVWRL